MERAASKRRKPRAEDHAGINEIGRFNNTFIEHTLRFRDHRRHKLAAKLFEARLRKLST
jgi:hypothetical protein